MSEKREGYLSQINLGSNGKLYDGKIPDGILLCEPWTTQEEMLLNSGINAHILLDKLIHNCCRLPEGLLPEDLTNHDRFQVFFHLRNISYPKPYHFAFKCSECGEKANATLNLMTDLETRHLGREPVLDGQGEPLPGQFREVPFAEPVALPLPSGTVVAWRYLRGKDEKLIEQYEKRVRSKNPNAPSDAGYQYRMALRFAQIDGVDVDIGAAMEFVSKLRAPESLALREDFDQKAHGIIPRVEPKCNHCQYPNGPFALPLDESFFRPRSERV
jgi:hypothetical protein